MSSSTSGSSAGTAPSATEPSPTHCKTSSSSSVKRSPSSPNGRVFSLRPLLDRNRTKPGGSSSACARRGRHSRRSGAGCSRRGLEGAVADAFYLPSDTGRASRSETPQRGAESPHASECDCSKCYPAGTPRPASLSNFNPADVAGTVTLYGCAPADLGPPWLPPIEPFKPFDPPPPPPPANCGIKGCHVCSGAIRERASKGAP